MIHYGVIKNEDMKNLEEMTNEEFEEFLEELDEDEREGYEE